MMHTIQHPSDSLVLESSRGDRVVDSRAASLVSNHRDIPCDPSVGDRIFCSMSSFFGMTSLGAIIPGHSLLCPELSLHSVSRERSLHDVGSSGDLLADLLEAKQKISDILRRAYGVTPVAFEHGSIIGFGELCGTNYPHMHFVPTDVPLSSLLGSELRYSYEASFRYRTMSDFFEESRGPGEYLLVEDANGVAVWWSGECRTFQSQFIRRVLQRKLGISPNSWKDIPGVDDAIRVATELRSTAMSLSY